VGRPDPTSTPPDPASTPLPELKGRSAAVGKGPPPPLACVARAAAASPAPGSSGEGEEEPGSVLPATGSGFPAAGSDLLTRIAGGREGGERAIAPEGRRGAPAEGGGGNRARPPEKEEAAALCLLGNLPFWCSCVSTGVDELFCLC